MPPAARTQLSRETLIGLTVTALAVAAMAVDHLLGDDPGLEDPPAFFISAGISVALAVILFGVAVPRAGRPARPERAATYGLVASVLAVVLFPFTLWLGVPFVLGGAGMALGLRARERGRNRRAYVAVALGGLVVLLSAAAYAYVAVDKLA